MPDASQAEVPEDALEEADAVAEADADAGRARVSS
jgi:hypothetical protein